MHALEDRDELSSGRILNRIKYFIKKCEAQFHYYRYLSNSASMSLYLYVAYRSQIYLYYILCIANYARYQFVPFFVARRSAPMSSTVDNINKVLPLKCDSYTDTKIYLYSWQPFCVME